MTEYAIINSAVNHSDTMAPERKVLKSVNTGGLFFSCNTIALMDVVHYYNQTKALPDEFDRFEQYQHYKTDPADNMIPMFFDEWCIEHVHMVDYSSDIPMPYNCMSIQFAPYQGLPFDDWGGIIAKYLNPSEHVTNTLYNLEQKYHIDYNNMCAVFFRGNDKKRETQIAKYDDFIAKAREVKEANPGIRFLVLPDEVEFLSAFKAAFPDAIHFDEAPGMPKKDSAIPFEMPRAKRAEQAVSFFAATLATAKCSHLITHSGNCGLWSVLYRGHANNVHQYFNGQWIT